MRALSLTVSSWATETNRYALSFTEQAQRSLRDFGKENLEEVVDWLNESYKSVVEKEIYIELRDSFITCDVEELGSFIIRNTNTNEIRENIKFELNNPTEYQGY